MLRGAVRIVGGAWRSRRIRFPPNASIKPTPDRVRETLFNWLAPIIEDAYCLDLFAGSGALGLEALSRGAKWVGFVENTDIAANALRQHISQFKANSRACVYYQSYKQLNEAQLTADMLVKEPINLVFLDPPFRREMLIASLNWITAQTFVSSDVYIYMEYEKGLVLPDAFTSNWQPYRQQQAGQINYGLWIKAK